MQTPSSNHSHSIYESPTCTPLRTKAYHKIEKRQDVRTPKGGTCQRSAGRTYTPDYGFDNRKRLPQMLEENHIEK